MDIIDLDKIDDDKEVLKMVVKGYGQLKPLLKDIFDDLNDEDFKGIKIVELVSVIIDLAKSIALSLNILKGDGKNQTGE